MAVFADLVSETRWWMDRMAESVEALRGEMRYDGAAGEQIRAEITLYERAADRLGNFLALWIKLGLDERMVKLSEKQGQLIADLLRRVFEDPELGLDSAQQATALTVTGRHLRLVS